MCGLFRMSQFDKIKREKFGEIKDFSDPQDKLRFTAGHKLSLGDWFWFSPWAFRFIMIGLPVSFMINSLVCLSLYFIFDKVFLLVFGILLFAVASFDLLSKIKHVRIWKVTNYNMYDKFLREYK